MKTIICTTGTSIARGARFQTGQDVESFRQEIRRRQEDLRGKTPAEKYLHAASAETNSISRLKPEQGDVAWLLHTETADGLVCTEETTRLLEEHFACDIRLRCVEGLQVSDAQRFRRVGVRRLFDALREICEPVLGSQQNGVLLNVTGGFKSVVPFITLFGLLNRLDVIYIFEQSETLLRLPPVPLNFDYERLGQARDAILQLEQAITMPREKFFGLIPSLDYSQRQYYESLLEEDEKGEVMLSGFAQMLVDQSRSVDQSEVWLHPHARENFDKSSGLVREVFHRMLEGMRDRLWRDNHSHKFHSSDIPCFSRGPNTTERLFSFLRGSRVYVCELFSDKKEYLNYKRQQDEYPIASFRHWQPASLTGLEQGLGDITKEWQARLDASQDEIGALQQRLDVSEGEAEKLLVSIEAAEAERDRVRSELEQANGEMARFVAASTEQAKESELRLGKLHTEQTALAGKNAELQARLVASQGEAEKLRASLEATQMESDELRSKLEQANREKMDLIAASGEQLKTLEKQLTEINAEKDALNAKNADLRARVAALESGQRERDAALAYWRQPFWLRWTKHPPAGA